MIHLTDFPDCAYIMQISWIFAFMYLIPFSVFLAYSMDNFCLISKNSFVFLHRLCKLETECLHAGFFRFIQGPLVPSYTAVL